MFANPAHNFEYIFLCLLIVSKFCITVTDKWSFKCHAREKGASVKGKTFLINICANFCCFFFQFKTFYILFLNKLNHQWI